ncbi:hypothetical protein PAECIP112173_01622 [Paenibacillus sp. JJ-100]|nr:hypothetical protein PAECIP112173_01622 [Paenibacillus sp. JJ-100]
MRSGSKEKHLMDFPKFDSTFEHGMMLIGLKSSKYM